MNPAEILRSLILKRAEAQLAAEWQAIEKQLTPALKAAGLGQLVPTEDVGYDQTFFHGLEVRNAAREIQPMTGGFLRLDIAATVAYAKRSHRAKRLPELITAATADVEARLNQLHVTVEASAPALA